MDFQVNEMKTMGAIQRLGSVAAVYMYATNARHLWIMRQEVAHNKTRSVTRISDQQSARAKSLRGQGCGVTRKQTNSVAAILRAPRTV